MTKVKKNVDKKIERVLKKETRTPERFNPNIISKMEPKAKLLCT